MVALQRFNLRYVTENGTIVEDDAVTPAPGPAAGPVDVLEGTVASASVPIVFPPRRLADDDYVDGGVLQVIPVRAATLLGASRIFAVRRRRKRRHPGEDLASKYPGSFGWH